MAVNTLKIIPLVISLYSFNSGLIAAPMIGVFSAYTYTNDLGISLNDSTNSDAISRSGLKLGADINWTDISYQGGSSIAFFANQDNDLSDNRNISDFGLNAMYLQSLSENWLLRKQIIIEQYRNEVLASTGFNGYGLAVTAGYIGKNNSGFDIRLKYFYEKHQEDKNDQYKTSRNQLALDYYFPAQVNGPQWSTQLHWKDNIANDNARDYTSKLIGVSYKNWTFKNIFGNISLQQRQDIYRPSSSFTRQDSLRFIGLDLFKPLSKNILLRSSVSSGLYQSNLQNTKQNYLQINIGLQVSL